MNHVYGKFYQAVRKNKNKMFLKYPCLGTQPRSPLVFFRGTCTFLRTTACHPTHPFTRDSHRRRRSRFNNNDIFVMFHTLFLCRVSPLRCFEPLTYIFLFIFIRWTNLPEK